MAAERGNVNRTSAAQRDEERSPEQLQRDLEQTRDSITQTVNQLGNTVTEIQTQMADEYRHIKTSVSETFDWRHQVRQHPWAFTVGAFAVGLLAGRSVAGNVSRRRLGTTMETPGEGRIAAVRASVSQSPTFGRLQDGLTRLVNEFVDELVTTGRNVVIPSLISKVAHSVGVSDEQLRRTRDDGIA
jgi:ElaB/YqjD/DUF883 family membrane-anchored ribosome-binding protein